MAGYQELTSMITTRVFVVAQTTPTDAVYPAGTDAVIVNGIPTHNQTREEEQSPAIFESRSVLDTCLKAPDAGDWSVESLVNRAGSAGDVPNGGSLLKALLGTETVVPATSVAYTPSIEKGYYTILIYTGNMSYMLVGCVATKGEISGDAAKGCYVTVKTSGKFFRRIRTGSAVMTGNSAAKVITVGIPASERFSVGGWVKFQKADGSVTDDNSGDGYIITQVDTGAGTITVDDTPSARVTGDFVLPHLPTVSATPQGVAAASLALSLNSRTIKYTDFKLNIEDGGIVPKERTTSGYPEVFVPQRRSVSFSGSGYLRPEMMTMFYAEEEADLYNLQITNTGTAVAGSQFTISCPATRIKEPTVADDGGLMSISFNGTVQATTGEDEVELLFG